MSVFKKLSEVNVSDKIEKKGTQNYLSWANAWGLAKQQYPELKRIVYEDSMTGLNYFTDGKSGYVKVGIIIENIECIDYLPIMSFNNKSIKIEDITSMDVNKTIQRSTTKALAMQGLALGLYSGEDLVTVAKTEKVVTLVDLNIGDSNWVKVLDYIKANKQLGLASVVKNLQIKYTISTQVKKELAKYIQ